jgi:type IV pilus assembly protein PilQ
MRDLRARLYKWICATSLSLLSMAAHAQNAIEAITGISRADVELVRIDFTEPLTTLPTGFVVQEPARIALDFPDMTNAVGRSTTDFNQGNLRASANALDQMLPNRYGASCQRTRHSFWSTSCS